MKIIRLPETESTNSYAIKLIGKNRPAEEYVVVASYQTNGKGLEANTWESERDKNLTFSIVLYPDFAADQQFILNKAISVGIRDFLQNEMPRAEIAIKWPNDIYVSDKKISGILIQNSLVGTSFEYSVVGIGLNVNQTLFFSNAPNPVSMKMITGIEYGLDDLLTKLLQTIYKWYNQVKTEPQKVEEAYKKALYRLMEWHNYEIKGSKIFAKITGTNEYGQLLIETDAGPIILCDLKEVKFLL